MNKKVAIQIVASGIGITALCIMVTLAVAWTSPGDDHTGTTISCNLVAIFFAIASWSGMLRKKKDVESNKPETWGHWLGMFVVGFFLSVVFLLMDCGGRLPTIHLEFVCNGHPGFAAIFTFAAIIVTVIALPSAIRAWILEKFGDTI